jgi:4-azaleucine resistance transporter AzlC
MLSTTVKAMSDTQDPLSFKEGVKDGFPIAVGYFPTAMAFGLVCRNGGMKLWEAALFSLSNFAGSGQFLAANLLFGGAMMAELVISVFLVNLRYLFMGAAVSTETTTIRGLKRAVVAFGTTDEVFSVSLLRGEPLTWPYMAGIEGTSYIGWVSGTFAGFLLGSLFSPALQLAVGVTLYAMFSSLLAQEFGQKGSVVIAIGAVSAILNTILILVCHLGTGWAFVISMLSAAIFGAMIDKEETK